MTTEDKFAFIAKKDRALADSILKRSDDMDDIQIDAMINIEYNYLVDVQVQNERYDMESITKRFLGASEAHLKAQPIE